MENPVVLAVPLSEVGEPDWANRRPTTLGGAMRIRVALRKLRVQPERRRELGEVGIQRPLLQHKEDIVATSRKIVLAAQPVRDGPEVADFRHSAARQLTRYGSRFTESNRQRVRIGKRAKHLSFDSGPRDVVAWASLALPAAERRLESRNRIPHREDDALAHRDVHERRSVPVKAEPVVAGELLSLECFAHRCTTCLRQMKKVDCRLGGERVAHPARSLSDARITPQHMRSIATQGGSAPLPCA
ncbi:hypothetical protein SAMN05421637_1735 [Demequina mangrovi]|uniref:Uncharacterized protein n=1 Tax=Demequina mangrovi TaxID=1043493 RepID=A0A1H6YJ71_9MICO|nr:hypothetical protein SAMN05421637_1735 [Demequina mangrovi]